MAFIEAHNETPRPFVRARSADDILAARKQRSAKLQEHDAVLTPKPI